MQQKLLLEDVFLLLRPDVEVRAFCVFCFGVAHQAVRVDETQLPLPVVQHHGWNDGVRSNLLVLRLKKYTILA